MLHSPILASNVFLSKVGSAVFHLDLRRKELFAPAYWRTGAYEGVIGALKSVII